MQGPKEPRTPVQPGHFSGMLEIIINATGIGIWDWHLPTGHVVYSPQWERIAGYEPGELPQDVSSWENALLPEDLDSADAAIQRYLDGEGDMYQIEFRMRRKDGVIIWGQDKGVITERDENGKPVRLVGVLQDVTPLKHAEEQIREQNEQLDFAAALSGLGSYDWDLRRNHISYNEEYMQMLGYRLEELTGSLEEWEGFIHPDDVAAVNQALDDYISGRSDSYVIEMRMRHKQGYYVWTQDMGRIVEWDEQGAPARVIGGHLNIDRRMRAELELQEAMRAIERHNEGLQNEVRQGAQDLRKLQQNSQAMFDANPHINLIFDDQFHLIDCNPAAVEFMHKRSKEQLFLEYPRMLAESLGMEPAAAQELPEAFLRHLRRAAEWGYDAFDVDLLRDGQQVPSSIALKRIAYGDSYAITLYQTDLTTVKRAQRDLEKQDRLLNAVNQSASLLISAQGADFDQRLWESLQTLGENADVDRVYVMRRVPGNEDLECTLAHLWTKGQPYAGRVGEVIELSSYVQALPNWQETLLSGGSISAKVADLPKETRKSLERHRVVSLLMLPLFIDNVFWGLIGLEDFERSRSFSRTEERILQSGGMLFALALLRDEMTQSLIAATEAALESTKAKSRFLANMSHEIRTPMNAIIGMATIAQNTRDTQRVEDCLDKILNASRHLLGIINDVLDMSKIEARKFELSEVEFSFQAMIQSLVNMNAGKIDEKKQHLVLDIDASVPDSLIGDELRISQVINNLLSNAIKFTPEQGTVRLTARQLSTTLLESNIEIAVEDDGIGILPEKVERLFGAFEQAELGTSRSFGGTGLGLSISKNIVEMMGGEIRVESEYGKGSRFVFNVVVRRGSEQARRRAQEQAPQPEAYRFPGKTILLVEDVFINREIVLSLLEDTGVTIDTAENGLLAYEMFQRDPGRYDMIFMDLHMPVMDGLAATEKIRALNIPAAKRVPIVAMTANAFAEDIAGCLAAGMNDHIAKPIDLSLLMQKTQYFLLGEGALDHTPAR